MASVPVPSDALHFRWPWRPAQQRVLDAVEAHLSDRRLHIVAAPGAGKTTLGLEVFRRLGHPAVVLAPTRTIRDQWVRRLADFLPEGNPDPPSWVSRSLDRPGFLVALTYQALHTRHRKTQASGPARAMGAPTGAELKTVIETFKANGVRTLLLDEAHHLRAGWWRALKRIVDHVDGLTLVALTATPPYDVSGTEWKRYEALCGPVDEEISVPELVRSGTLCPHQDFVHVVMPSEAERRRVAAYEGQVRDVTASLLADDTFRAAVEGHAWIAHEHPDPADVLEHPECAVALLVYLKAAGAPVKGALPVLLGTSMDELPGLERRWWQVLVQAYLFGEGWPDLPAIVSHQKALRRDLTGRGLLHGRELRIGANRRVESDLVRSTAKIGACLDIHSQERCVRGRALRQVVLTDFIRDRDVGRLGAWPIFERLARSEYGGLGDVALLTGRRVVLHRSRLERLQALPGAEPAACSVQPVEGLDGYVRIDRPGGGSALVRPLTRLLAEGALTTLVGTRALLGEGWDAPVVNSLVLCSYVGSFVTTNQMRGRAIRRDPAHPGKVASIWHLVAVDLESESGVRDVENLHRRFETFAGLSADGRRIESGLARLHLPILTKGTDPERWNEHAVRRLADLDALKRWWEDAVHLDEAARLGPVVELQARRPPSVRAFRFANTLRYLVYSAISAFGVVMSESLQVLRNLRDAEAIRWGLLIAGAGGLLYAGPHLVRALRIAWRHAPVEGTLREMGRATKDALCGAGVFETPASDFEVSADEREAGVWSVSIRGGTYYERALFSSALAEVLAPIENPRYLVSRRGRGRWKGRLDYHAVPAVLAVNKERAGVFAACWRERIGPAELMYTRTREGRAVLLKARGRALSDVFADPVHRRDRWQ